MKIEAEKNYRTRCGLVATIYRTGIGSDNVIHGSYFDPASKEQDVIYCWFDGGNAAYSGKDPLDLLEEITPMEKISPNKQDDHPIPKLGLSEQTFLFVGTKEALSAIAKELK